MYVGSGSIHHLQVFNRSSGTMLPVSLCFLQNPCVANDVCVHTVHQGMVMMPGEVSFVSLISDSGIFGIWPLAGIGVSEKNSWKDQCKIYESAKFLLIVNIILFMQNILAVNASIFLPADSSIPVMICILVVPMNSL